VKLADLHRLVALTDNGLRFPQTAERLGVPLASLYSSIDRLEAEVGHPLINRGTPPWTLTEAGALLLDEAKRRIADAPDELTNRTKPAGGKAKASKGKGRAPVVKGQPKPFKKRQGR